MMFILDKGIFKTCFIPGLESTQGTLGVRLTGMQPVRGASARTHTHVHVLACE